MRRVALGALQGLSSRRRLRRCIGRLEVLGVLAPGRGRHAHHRAWRWNSNRACERALRYQLGDKIHGFTVNQDLQNLLSVYLDATFFPCLRELDFWVKSEEAPGTFSEGLGGRRTRWMKNKKEMHQHSLAGSVTHRTRMKTCTPAVRAFSLTGAPRAISTGHYVDASVTKWKASGPGGACSDQERPESKKHGEQMHDAQGWMARLGLAMLTRLASNSWAQVIHLLWAPEVLGLQATHASLNPGRCSRWRNLQEADLLGFANGPSGPRGICCAELLWIRLFNTWSLKTPRPYLSTGDSRARVGFIENKSLPLSALVCHVSGCLFHPDKHNDRNSKQRNSKKIHTSP
ncbi:uncharacterized protein [Macaca nemestrina]|uniref:uncharacterized protein isoform X1 n=1 Tax=Macaca nemestrina TaxID=9545 RepID=UPI0039B9BCC7